MLYRRNDPGLFITTVFHPVQVGLPGKGDIREALGNLVQGKGRDRRRGPRADIWGVTTLHTVEFLHFGEFRAPGDVWGPVQVTVPISWVCSSAVVPFGLRKIDDTRFDSVLQDMIATLERVVDYPSLVNLANCKHQLSAIG